MIKAASSVPPAVKPTGHKTSVAAAEMMRQMERPIGAMSPEIEEATRNLREVLEQQYDSMAANLKKLKESLPPNPPPPIAPPSQEGDNDGMEARVSKLEDFAVETRERLARVETKLDHIDKEVSNFKWWVIAQIVAGLLAVLGTGIAIQQMTVASFQGAAQIAKDAAPPAPAQPPIIINVPQGYERGNGIQAPPTKP